jgi:hypothetical protein
MIRAAKPCSAPPGAIANATDFGDHSATRQVEVRFHEVIAFTTSVVFRQRSVS